MEINLVQASHSLGSQRHRHPSTLPNSTQAATHLTWSHFLNLEGQAQPFCLPLRFPLFLKSSSVKYFLTRSYQN